MLDELFRCRRQILRGHNDDEPSVLPQPRSPALVPLELFSVGVPSALVLDDHLGFREPEIASQGIAELARDLQLRYRVEARKSEHWTP